MKPSIIRLLAFSVALTTVPVLAGEVARVGDETITSAELERAASTRLLRVRTDIYDARRTAAEKLIGEMLIAKAAAAEKLTPEAWLDREIAKRWVEVTAAEVEAAYATVTGTTGTLSKEEELAGLARNMREVRRQETREAIARELRAGAKIDIRLEPPRLPHRDLGGITVHGADDAPVTLIVFEDFECSFSAQLGPVLAALRERYPKELRIVHRDLPLQRHPNAKRAAEAAACAAEEGAFWEMAEQMYRNQQALDRASLEQYAAAAKLDRERFAACMDSGRHAHHWNEGISVARRYAVRGTPAMFINGRLLAGARELENVVAVIDEELARAAR